MYPPDALVRFSKRFLVPSSIRPGKERLFRWIAVLGLVFTPALAVFLVAMFALWDPPPNQVWVVWLMTASLTSCMSSYCGMWAVLTAGSKPLLSAWLVVASLGASLLMALAYVVVAYLSLGWIAAAGVGLLVVAIVAVDAYRSRPRATG